jgi:hypothetical protein
VRHSLAAPPFSPFNAIPPHPALRADLSPWER